MKQVTVNGKVGHVTSANPQRNGKYQVWFEGEQKCTQVDKNDVVFNMKDISLMDPAIAKRMPIKMLDEFSTDQLSEDRMTDFKKAFDNSGSKRQNHV